MGIDYNLKADIFRNHKELLKQVSNARYMDYAFNQFLNDGVIIKNARLSNAITSAELLNQCKEKGLLKEFLECVKINNANYHREKRLRSRISTMLNNGDNVFLTLTFNDASLSNMSAKSRRVAVVRFLKSLNAQYVANIDYGAKNHREHYHALVNKETVLLDGWRKKYGAINCERIHKTNDRALSKYISKLTNHAIKETTKRCAIIYSR